MLHWLRKHKKSCIRGFAAVSAVFGVMCGVTAKVLAAEGDDNLISIGISAGDGSDMASVLQMLIVLTVRAAIGTQTVPPNQIIIGLSLFLTVFVMAPTFTEIYDNAITPLSNNEMTAEEAFDEGIKPLRTFMLKQTSTKDLDTFLKIAGYEEGSVKSEDDITLRVLIPSFIISELRIAFIIGFLIYLPFIVIDMVVSSTLMSMGMMMLPPTTISTPFKILLFVMADGWNLIIGNLMMTFK